MPLILLANGGVALLTSGTTLLLLLIAPLGLAAVLTCTVLVALLSFGAGVVKDLLLWRWLGRDGGVSPIAAMERAKSLMAGRGGNLARRRPERLPEPRQR